MAAGYEAILDLGRHYSSFKVKDGAFFFFFFLFALGRIESLLSEGLILAIAGRTTQREEKRRDRREGF